jgi:hypothetical protein
MAGRNVGEILAEWRAAERELEDAADDPDREDIEARIAALRDAYGAAIEANGAPAKESPGGEPEPAGV